MRRRTSGTSSTPTPTTASSERPDMASNSTALLLGLAPRAPSKALQDKRRRLLTKLRTSNAPPVASTR